MKKIIIISLFAVLFSAISFQSVYALPYDPGETLNPTCVPGSTNCSVAVALVYPSTGLPSSSGSAWGPSLTEAEGKVLFGASSAWSLSPFSFALPGTVGAVLYSDGTNWTRNTAPIISAANMTSLPTFNQNTTGTAATITGSIVKANTPLTTKGDLWVTDGTSMHRLSVGTDAQVLTADAASTDGVKWSAA